jgi:hypothetical protein
MPFLRYLRRCIQRLRPYPSLFLLATPLVIIELLKLAAVFVLGSGHWMTGSIVMLCAYALSVLAVERLFKLVKPKLLMLPWFSVMWTWLVVARDKTVNWLRRSVGRARDTAYQFLGVARARSTIRRRPSSKASVATSRARSSPSP